MSSNSNTPRLRFPEFKEEWKEKKFKDITISSGKRNSQNLPYERYSISNENGFYPQNEQFEGGAGYLKNIDCSKHIIVSPKTFAYNPARINIGSIGYQNLDHDVIVSPLYEIFKTNDSCDDDFLWQWFHTEVFNRLVINGQEGGVRLCFSYNKLQQCSIKIPSLPEQQKIASCLTEMDNLIAAQGQKVEALKEKKKGLMQQLFPQNGESTPRLRFPGFEGEWREKKLGEVGNTISGLTYSPSNVSNNGLLVLRSSNIKDGTLCFDDCVYVQSIKKYNPVKENDILICVRNGSTNLIGKNALIPRGLSSAFGAFMMVFRSTAWSFVFQLLRTERYSEQIEQNLGARINSINSEDFKNYTFLFPPNTVEQQKIASFLSEFDSLIAAESNKLENLKNYKKGLMQQLFPQPVK